MFIKKENVALAKKAKFDHQMKLKRTLKTLYKQEGIQEELLNEQRAPAKKSKANPFKRHQIQFEKEREERQKIIEEQRLEEERINNEKNKKKLERQSKRSVFLKKSRKGQPLLSNQIGHLLQKIKGSQ